MFSPKIEKACQETHNNSNNGDKTQFWTFYSKVKPKWKILKAKRLRGRERRIRKMRYVEMILYEKQSRVGVCRLKTRMLRTDMIPNDKKCAP